MTSSPTGTDLSNTHAPCGGLVASPTSPKQWDAFRLTDDQADFYHENGYVAGVRILDDEQIEALRGELSEFLKPDHAGCDLWHEYHANESSDPQTVLFHALGAWRIAPGFHDLP